MRIAALDDLQGPEDALDERKGSSCCAQQVTCAIAILNVGWMDGDAQQQAERIDEDVPFTARDLFARVESLWVERRAPFMERPAPLLHHFWVGDWRVRWTFMFSGSTWARTAAA